MSKIVYAGEQMKIEIDGARTRRDVKGYVQMVKEQKGEEKRKYFPPSCVRRGDENALQGQKEEEKKQMMLEFIKLTLPAKMKIISERYSCLFDGEGYVCNLYVKHSSIKGAGQVRYSFTNTTCKYQDWMGNEIIYSQSWTDFQERRGEREI